MNEIADFNQQIIDEFRANGGNVGGQFEGASMVLLHHTGARSGTERVNPLVYQSGDGEVIYIFGSRGGAPTHPDWFHNLVAHPDTTIEIGSETRPVRARVLEGDERTKIWEQQKQQIPGFAEYEQSAGDREIPVVALEPR